MVQLRALAGPGMGGGPAGGLARPLARDDLPAIQISRLRARGAVPPDMASVAVAGDGRERTDRPRASAHFPTMAAGVCSFARNAMAALARCGSPWTGAWRAGDATASPMPADAATGRRGSPPCARFSMAARPGSSRAGLISAGVAASRARCAGLSSGSARIGSSGSSGCAENMIDPEEADRALREAKGSVGNGADRSTCRGPTASVRIRQSKRMGRGARGGQARSGQGRANHPRRDGQRGPDEAARDGHAHPQGWL